MDRERKSIFGGRMSRIGARISPGLIEGAFIVGALLILLVAGFLFVEHVSETIVDGAVGAIFNSGGN